MPAAAILKYSTYIKGRSRFRMTRCTRTQFKIWGYESTFFILSETRTSSDSSRGNGYFNHHLLPIAHQKNKSKLRDLRSPNKQWYATDGMSTKIVFLHAQDLTLKVAAKGSPDKKLQKSALKATKGE